MFWNRLESSHWRDICTIILNNSNRLSIPSIWSAVRVNKVYRCNRSSLMLKGMWCHERTLSTAVIHSAANFPANKGGNLCHCSLYTRQLFILSSFYPTPLLPEYTGCPCCRSLNNEMLFETCAKIVLMAQYQLWSGGAWLETEEISVSGVHI